MWSVISKIILGLFLGSLAFFIVTAIVFIVFSIVKRGKR